MTTQPQKSQNVLIASSASSVLSTLCVNPIDIVKIRQQKLPEIQGCGCRKPSKFSSFLSSRSATSFYIISSRLTLFLGGFSSVKLCHCFPQQSLLSGLSHIIKMEGFTSLFNGVRYAAAISCFSNVLFFHFYEKIKSSFSNVTTNSFCLPLFSSFAARTIATTFVFPLDYWKTIQYSIKGRNKKKNFELGDRIFSAYSVTIQRDIIFSIFYWVLVENIRKLLNGNNANNMHMTEGNNRNSLSRGEDKNRFHMMKNNEGLVDVEENNFRKKQKGDKILIDNIIAGSLAGAVASFVSLPLDVVKTRKQVHKELADVGTMDFLKQIKREGMLFAGIKPRIVKTMIHCGLTLSGYEYTLSLLERDESRN